MQDVSEVPRISL